MVEAVQAIKEPGYMVKDACSVLGFSRSCYYALRQPKEAVKKTIEPRDAELFSTNK